ncbi:MAG: nitrate reductase subunit alpha [Acidobacteriota bacterium]
MGWIRDLFSPQGRAWEDFYRNRWAYDRVVRSTHGVNCTGSCSWNIYVKQGLVTWELQALDYPRFDPTIPPYEPRGCQRGISYSWYLYSPLRVKYPYVRGRLWRLWREAKQRFPADPLAAWEWITTDEERRKSYQRSRGKGGFQRVSWEEVLELIAAANLSTVRRYGPDRLIGFSPIPAMSMVSYAAGARFMQLMGGVSLSFYDWYCDLPPASPEIWGEQTDVGESADWYKAQLIAVVGSNVLSTRTPDAHFLVEARHRGAKVVVFSPDFSQTSKVADEWIPIHQGQDAAFWLAVGHVILREYFVERSTPQFSAYLKKYADAPFLVLLEKTERGAFRPGRLLRAVDLPQFRELENAEWKPVLWDGKSGQPRVPLGTVGHRWEKTPGRWNLSWQDEEGRPIEPEIWLDGAQGEAATVEFPRFDEEGAGTVERPVPAVVVETPEGPVHVTTVMELLAADYGVVRAGGSEALPSYEDEREPYTPAWQEKYTGISAANVVAFARQWAETALRSGGRCMIIIGAGANHWYHNNLIYRACIVPLILCGCVGKNGGGWNHYVGQEKLVPQASWAPIAFALDWGGPPRLQNTPSFHFMHSDQWRYEGPFTDVCPTSDPKHRWGRGHAADLQAVAVRNGWLPCTPHFNKPLAEILAAAREAGAATPDAVKAWVAEQFRRGELRFSMEDPDNPASYPRVWYIWRGNAIQASAKGHEYFLKHYLGTDHNSVAEEQSGDLFEEVVWHERVDTGKMDLIIDLNFRMDTSALYSDIVLPAATYYEKDDLSTTDLHTFIHPLQAAVSPCWEAKSDWAIFRDIAEVTARMAEKHLPEPVLDIVATPFLHDSPQELNSPRVVDWKREGQDPIPGKNFPNLTVVERHYPSVFRKFISLGPLFGEKGLGAHGVNFPVADLLEEYERSHPTEEWEGRRYVSLRRDRDVCNVILHFAPETNGELAWRAFESLSKKTGKDHSHLAAGTRTVRYDFVDLTHQPRRILTSPIWSGITANGRTYSAFCQNVEEEIPWRTLTGRQHLYLDHEAYRAFGEHLPVYKPRPGLRSLADLERSGAIDSNALVLNYLTPHGKWHIHSTFGDNHRMCTLSRGVEPVWLNDRDAGRLGIRDNDWVEILNDHGVVVTRACVSARIPSGVCFIYHATERTLSVPRSPSRNGNPAGAHNSLTKARLKPLFMIGGYAQFSWSFNYWGPPGVNRDTFVLVRPVAGPQW